MSGDFLTPEQEEKLAQYRAGQSSPAPDDGGEEAEATLSDDQEQQLQQYRAQQSQPAAPAAEPSAMHAFASHAVHGGSLGRSDEAAGVGYNSDPVYHREAMAGGYSLGGPEIPRTAGRGMSAPLSSESNAQSVERELAPMEPDRLTRGIGGQPTGQGDYQAGIEGRRDELAEEKRTSPTASMLGEVVGAGAVTAPLSIAAAPAGAGALLAEGAAIGGAYAAGESESETAGGVLADTATGAAFGGPANAIMPGLGGKASDAMSRMAQGLGRKASRNRVAASGGYGSQLRSLAENRGDDYIVQLGDDIERLGLHRGEGAGGSLPQPASTYLRNAEEAADVAGQTMQRTEADIAAAGSPMANVSPAIQRLEGEAAKRTSTFHPSGPGEGAKASEFADRIKGQTVGMGPEGSQALTPVTRALKEKRDLYSRVNYARRGGADAGPYEEQLNRDVAAILNREGVQGLDDAVSRGDLPGEVVDAWKQANTDFGAAQQTRDFAHGRTWQEQGNQVISLPGWLGAGAGSSAGGALGAVPGAAAAQLLKSRGRSAMAGTQRAGADAMASFARQGAPAAGAVRAGARRGAVASGAPASALPAPSPAPMSGSPETVLAQIEDNPGAYGKYTPAIEKAARRGDAQAVQTILYAMGGGQ